MTDDDFREKAKETVRFSHPGARDFDISILGFGDGTLATVRFSESGREQQFKEYVYFGSLGEISYSPTIENFLQSFSAHKKKLFALIEDALPKLAMLLMLYGILVPAVMYGLRQGGASPVQVITCICISLFASILFLWILDAMDVMTFRSHWVSRSIYGIAVSSILAASVGIYKDAFADHLHPFDGFWHVTCSTPKGYQIADNLDVLLYYSKSSGVYSGYSSFNTSSVGTNISINCTPVVDDSIDGPIRYVTIDRFDPTAKSLSLKLTRNSIREYFIENGVIELKQSSFAFTNQSFKFAFYRK